MVRPFHVTSLLLHFLQVIMLNVQCLSTQIALSQAMLNRLHQVVEVNDLASSGESGESWRVDESLEVSWSGWCQWAGFWKSWSLCRILKTYILEETHQVDQDGVRISFRDVAMFHCPRWPSGTLDVQVAFSVWPRHWAVLKLMGNMLRNVTWLTVT